ncbi:E2 ligase fold family C protein [Methylobacterium ajmalii]|uniref:E2 ligase fold family C protein n=1 Tax=Methylobacterium ajmalii TaxID=2738439 RepID=A0ABU9ZYV2_9HYPH
MALAPFFERAATAASQVLSEFGTAAFADRLQAHVVGIAFDGEAARSREGAATLDLTVRLLARLYPTLAIEALDDGGRERAVELRALASAINPVVDLNPDCRRATVVVCVGGSVPDTDATVLYAGSDGWIASFARSGPLGSGETSNPFGAGVTACLAAANVFRTVFRDQLVNGDLDPDLALDLRSYRPASEVTVADPLGRIDLGEAHLVGLGAIGNGAVWALARIEDAVGTLHLVDHEAVDLSNLQRYAMAGHHDIDAPKVDVAARVLGTTGLRVVRHQMSWDAYLADRGDWRLERVAVALDTAADRIAAQGSLPRWIANAWTQEGDLGVSRHGFDDGRACLACLYLPQGAVKDEDDRIAEELGMPEAQPEIRRMLQTGESVPVAFVDRIAAALRIPSGALHPFVGQPLRSFYQNAICGGVVFRLTDGEQPVKAVVPMAFQSAMAGLMLAAELVKHASGTLDAPTTITRLNLLRPIGSHLHDPRQPDVSGRCLCGDSDFRDAYRCKYPVA